MIEKGGGREGEGRRGIEKGGKEGERGLEGEGREGGREGGWRGVG